MSPPESDSWYEDALVFAHVSDIHFKIRTGGGHAEVDTDIRMQMRNDFRAMHRVLGAVDAILVTGDIAYSGQEDQYADAKGWLDQLCDEVGCPRESVWTVCGNHDVDQGVVKASKHLQSTHEAMRAVAIDKINDELHEYLSDPVFGGALYSPIAEYNRFALPYDCSFTEKRRYWEHNWPLNDGSTLRMRGLNTAIISDHRDDDGQNRLVAGISNCTMHAEEGVEYMVLLHHPYDWLRDHDDVQSWLDSRSRLQLFGHKHRQRLELMNNRSLRVHAGAANPSPGEPPYEPRYNYICLKVVEQDGQRVLSVRIHARLWNDATKEFRTEHGPDDDGATYDFTIPLDRWSPPCTAPNESMDEGVSGETHGSPVGQRDAHADRAAMNPRRRLAYRFLTLPYHHQVDVLHALHLIRDGDERLGEDERLIAVFERAAESKRLGELWREVELRHEDGQPQNDPFQPHEDEKAT